MDTNELIEEFLADHPSFWVEITYHPEEAPERRWRCETGAWYSIAYVSRCETLEDAVRESIDEARQETN